MEVLKSCPATAPRAPVGRAGRRAREWPGSRLRRWLQLWTRLGSAFLMCALAAPSGAEMDEYRVKAAFLYNFAKFVEWPVQNARTGHEPITICLLGTSPLEQALEGTVGGKSIEGREFQISELHEGQHAATCHILFVGSPERRRFRAMRETLKGAGVLTVGDEPVLAEEGTVITFRLEAGRVRLDINLAAADYENVRISSKLLTLARVVRRPL